jgi:hypothetical protein
MSISPRAKRREVEGLETDGPNAIKRSKPLEEPTEDEHPPGSWKCPSCVRGFFFVSLNATKS